MSEPTSLAELLRDRQDYIDCRGEMADHGRYYLYDPDIAAEHVRLTKLIEDTTRQLDELYPVWRG